MAIPIYIIINYSIKPNYIYVKSTKSHKVIEHIIQLVLWMLLLICWFLIQILKY